MNKVLSKTKEWSKFWIRRLAHRVYSILMEVYVCQFPLYQSMRLIKAFQELQEMKAKNRFKDFSPLITNLEQIFFRLAEAGFT